MPTTKEKRALTNIWIGPPIGWTRFWRRLLTALLLAVVPIAAGIAADSAAMQWSGFVMGLLLFGSLAVKSANEHTFRTVDAAKAFLDQLKAEGRAE